MKIVEGTIAPSLAHLLTAKKESCGGLLFSHASPRVPPIAPSKLPVPSAVGNARNMGAFGSEDDPLRGKDSVNVLDDALRRWCPSSVRIKDTVISIKHKGIIVARGREAR